MNNATSTSKGERTPPRSLSTILNTLYMEEENSSWPTFLLSFEIFNCNVHNLLVDSGAIANVMLLSIAKNISAQWSETSVRIIKIDKKLVPTIGELLYVII